MHFDNFLFGWTLALAMSSALGGRFLNAAFITALAFLGALIFND